MRSLFELREAVGSSMDRGLFVFSQAEDGMRGIGVTGVQTCALPICGQFRAWPREFVAGALALDGAAHGRPARRLLGHLYGESDGGRRRGCAARGQEDRRTVKEVRHGGGDLARFDVGPLGPAPITPWPEGR